jgi:phenylacetate-coenzyme A ligase PaaK-like adenylate-forming protein
MSLAASAGFVLRTLHLKNVAWQDADRVGRVQERRLRRLLHHAVRNSPFYRDKFGRVDWRRCPLQELPTTTKSEMMAHFEEAVTDPAVRCHELTAFLDDPTNQGRFYLGRYAASQTSGSQGQPLLIVQDRFCLDLLFALQCARGNAVTALNVLGAVRRFVQPARMSVVLMKEGVYPSVAAFDHMPSAVKRFVQVQRVAPSGRDLHERLNAFRPHVLIAYASVLETLALAGDRLHLGPDLRQVVNNSETLTSKARERLQRAFQVPVLDNYACGECLFLSNGCPDGPGAHVNADWAILENVDESNRPVPPGRLGSKVLMTNLANLVQPFIRYELGDRLVMAETLCGCGRRLPRIARIEGRSADVFWIRAPDAYRQVQGEVFKHALDYIPEIREWQAVQEDRNRFQLRLEYLPGEAFDPARVWQVLDRQLRLFHLDGLLEIRLEPVAALAADPETGKFRRLVSHLGPPPEAVPASSTRLSA